MSAVLDLPALPRRVGLTLADLVRAARLAGGVPLPLRLAVSPADLIADRLGGASSVAAADVVRRALRQPDHLAAKGLVVDGVLACEVALALRVLAGGALTVQVDLAVRRRAGVVPLRSWFGVGHGLVAQLSTSSGLEHELGWFAPGLWRSQAARTLTVAGACVGESGLPDVLSMPSEELVAGCAAVRAGRDDLLRLVAPDHTEAITVLETTCRGRLRLLVRRGDRVAVSSWVLHDDGWRELRPGPVATARLTRRDPRDVASWLAPVVAEAAGGSR